MKYYGSSPDYDYMTKFDKAHPVLSAALGALMLGGFLGIMMFLGFIL